MPRRFLWIALASVSVGGCAATIASPPTGSLCDVAARERLACGATAHGKTIAADDSALQRLLPLMRQGEARFARFFGSPPPRYLLVYGRGDRLRTIAAVAPVPAKLVWASAAERADSAQIAKAVEKALLDAGLSADQVARELPQQLAAAGVRSQAQHEADDVFAVPHELGHVWFSRLYWPSHDPASEGGYASPAADWIDEGVAQLMENGGSKPFGDAQAARFKAAKEMIQQRGLRQLLEMEHPAARLKKLNPADIPASGFTDEQLQALGIESTADFYLRSAALTAFLIDRSDDDRIMAALAAALAEGLTFEEWLSRDGRARNLPTDVASLEQEWRSWLQLL